MREAQFVSLSRLPSSHPWQDGCGPGLLRVTGTRQDARAELASLGHLLTSAAPREGLHQAFNCSSLIRE